MMSDTTTINGTDAGRGSAMIVYILYLLSIPSAAVFALVGVIVAYVSRDGAGPLARAHLDNAIRFWWTAFWWCVGCGVLIGIGIVLTPILIGFPVLWLAALIGFIIFVWFTVKSLLGLLRLFDGRP